MPNQVAVVVSMSLTLQSERNTKKELIRKSELMTYDPSTSTSLLKPVLTAARKQNQITVIALIVGRNSKQTA